LTITLARGVVPSKNRNGVVEETVEPLAPEFE
jgi:hypothetical protein